MYLYYGLLTVSVIMFGVQFFFSERYSKESGSGAEATFLFTLLSALSGIVCLFIINGFSLSFTWFTLLMAAVNTVNSVLFSFCSLKSLGKINLSLYSLFSMLGGMMLPLVVGIAFYGEPVTLGIIICVIFVVAALLLNVNFSKSKGGIIYYAGIFVLNGMSGVISKIYADAKYPKANSAEYSIWCAIVAAVMSVIILAAIGIVKKKAPIPSFKASVWGLGGGALSRIANYFLLIALVFLPASVQYTFITGGVMIVSTIISAIAGQKPSKKEILAIALSFVGILALVFLKF